VGSLDGLESAILDREFDVIVLGAGCAGLVCAIAAQDLGGKAIVLEKMARPAGNTLFAGGVICAVGTRLQMNQGIQDSVETFYQDLMKASHQRGDPDLTRVFAAQSGEGIRWLTDRVGVEWEPILERLPSVRGRLHEVKRPSHRGGAQLIKKLLSAAAKGRIPLRYKTDALELLANKKNEVCGVRVRTKEGPQEIRARGGVVMATGGFHANKEMVRAYMPAWAVRMPLRGSKSNTGENITLTQPFQAKLVNMDQFHCGPIHGPTQANPSSAVNYGICVSKEGRRYVNENWTYVTIGKETARKIRDNRAFIILDEEAKKEPLVAERFARYRIARAVIWEAEDIAGLAMKAGMKAEELVRTVNEYNEAVRKKKAGTLVPPNTLPAPRLIASPKFYAIPFQGGMTATFGGPLINTQAQVIDTRNRVIPGLYAAGNAAGGLFFEDYLVGSQLGAAVVFGRIAAADACARARKDSGGESGTPG
jgi:fumarate reductase flavoprotein subunit